MGKDFSSWIYKLAFFVLLLFAIMAMLAFMKALCQTPPEKVRIVRVTNPDSLHIVHLEQKIDSLDAKVESLTRLLNKMRPSSGRRLVTLPKENIVVDVHILKDSISK